MIKILSCDGGGIRGLLTAKLLERLEEELQKHRPSSVLRDYFDLFAGTSTGSIIACGLAQGMSARSICEFYEKEGEKIFPKISSRFWVEKLIERVSKGDFSLPLFKPDGLEKVLSSQDLFPSDLLFGELGKPTLVVSYDTYNRKAVVFKSQELKSTEIPVWQVCRASSAAPAAFSGYLLQNKKFLEIHTSGKKFPWDLNREIPPEGIPLIDGGLLANNPTLCAIAEEVKKDVPLTNILVASFGTGQSTKRIYPNDVINWGTLDWANPTKGIPLYQVCADGSADVIDYIATSLLKENYLRYQPLLEVKSDDDISPFQADENTLNLLKEIASNYLKEEEVGNRLRELASKLIDS